MRVKKSEAVKNNRNATVNQEFFPEQVDTAEMYNQANVFLRSMSAVLHFTGLSTFIGLYCRVWICKEMQETLP